MLSKVVQLLARFAAGRSAIVTGAAQGIGRAIAERLLAEGVSVLIVDMNKELTERTAEALSMLGTVHALVVDLADAGAADAVATAASFTFGTIDILVNNAGIARSARVDVVEIARWNEVLSVNLTAPFMLAQAVLPYMVAQQYGRVINISSFYGLQGFRQNSDYSVSKAALIALTRSIAVDFGRSGVTCNAIAPGLILTPMARAAVAAAPSWYRRGVSELKPVERAGEPGDIAAAVAYFAADEAGYVSGQVLAVDGGLTATRFVPDRFEGESAGH